MKKPCHSLTAYKAAVMRAAHQVLDNPKIYEDPLALSVISAQDASAIRSGKRKFKTKLYSYLRANVVARSKFVEDELSVAFKNGVRQYVILGAGLDTFAYRNPYSTDGLKVFEVDHPTTQTWKRKQLSTAEIAIPESLIFAPIDFESQDLIEQLQKVGFKTDELTLFSWLGVTMYLTKETVIETIKNLTSSMPSGNILLFDYVLPPSSQSFIRRIVFNVLAYRIEVAGEPWQSFFEPNSLRTNLKNIGFKRTEDLGPKEINSRFFNDRTDKLKVGSFIHLIKAQL